LRSNQLTHFCHRLLPVFYSLLLLLLISPALHAETSPTKEEDQLPSIRTLEPLDRYRDTASQKVTRFANWIDNFFANDRIYNEAQRSYIKLYLIQTHIENNKSIYDAQIKAKLDIPKTQKRLQLFIESIDEDESDAQQTSIDETIEKQEQSIGLRFLNLDSKLWKVTTIAGIRFHSGVDPFGRIRLRRLTEKGSWTYRFTESIFWFESDGAGETTRFDMDHPLTKNLLFRSTSQATWKNITDQFDIGQDLILFQTINKHKSLAYQVGGRAIKDSELYSTDYFYLVRYRQKIHKNWMFLDIIPAINHPRDNDFKPVRSISLKLEIVFDAK